MTQSQPIYDLIARAVHAEGVRAQFALMGDGNMHFSTVLSKLPEVETIHLRHEHCTVAAAMAWSGATGGIGLASVTCGPGVTQLMTALTQAARTRMPLICFVGEAPMHKPWYSQDIDQAALIAPTGAHYVAARSPKTIHENVQRAFMLARRDRLPVVIGVPYDLQKEPADGRAYQPAPWPAKRPALPPEEGAVAMLADALAGAQRPMILAGRGVINSGATDAVEALAEASGALLSNTLPAMGLFDHNPYSIGVAGGYAREYAIELAHEADVVVAFGASLSVHTLGGGGFFGKARTIQVDLDPAGMFEGVWGADDWVIADAGRTATAVTKALKGRKVASGVRTKEVADKLARDVNDSAQRVQEPDRLDPRTATEVIEATLDKEMGLVQGNGHQSFWQAGMRGFKGGNSHVYKNFSAIGSGLSFAIGASVAAGNDRLAFIEGDGSLMMHVQELDTIRRHGLKMLIMVMNDGAYGSEIHKLRAQGIDDSEAIHGISDIGAIARGFGLRGVSVTTVDELKAAIESYDEGEGTLVINIHISDQVATPRMRAQVSGKGH
ncbi:hypothetical protein ATO6_03355 [Oceanicola sp. 22II-s10i]|uniref:thiamine pyrophosphate-binding protein n=1 Tax=Oceanicola sp. 22II-s10i TaxID=1317116 RepID=UPI000B526194|nr:thiamine pyrophosphate-binding protein [Oceanicola sp. 22II-s10i]OWU85933.1 hypothetical protein ATO6_03355 [Oceanicola sp. 22II-s10i]